MSTEDEVYQLRTRVNELEAQVNFLYNHLGLTFQPAANLDDPRIIEQLRRGNTIEAIKVHRELYNTGLAEAKKAVDEMKMRLRL